MLTRARPRIQLLASSLARARALNSQRLMRARPEVAMLAPMKRVCVCVLWHLERRVDAADRRAAAILRPVRVTVDDLACACQHGAPACTPDTCASPAGDVRQQRLVAAKRRRRFDNNKHSPWRRETIIARARAHAHAHGAPATHISLLARQRHAPERLIPAAIILPHAHTHAHKIRHCQTRAWGALWLIIATRDANLIHSISSGSGARAQL